MPDRKEINKRGYLKEDFRLFHLKDSRAQKVDYHYHAFDKLILLLGERSPMWWRASPTSFSPGTCCWWDTT
ncbi:hypothetical protein [Dysosmobacter welbionis]|uniref:hypothetical protein n=1 Tax=Dysosmobacter welbionis TaxID=2093857 RepID=UPI0020176598|nr:hypothetical protein [Dysosmobacter welbionis]